MNSDDKPSKPGNAKANSRTCILVLGMHRSGTSAVTRTLNYLGAALPEHILSPNPSNASGHWEPRQIVKFDECILQQAHSRWDDWHALDLSALPPGALDRVKTELRRLITASYGDAALFVLKDPRICRLVPLYLEVLESLAITVKPVLVLRNPLAVCASLRERDGLSAEASQLLWLRHVLEAAAHTSRVPRAVIAYEALLADWRQEMARLGDFLAEDFPTDAEETVSKIDTFLSEDLQHHKKQEEDLSSDRTVVDCVKQAYTTLMAASRGMPAQTDGLENARQALDTVSRLSADELWQAVSGAASGRKAGDARDLVLLALKEKLDQLPEIERQRFEIDALNALVASLQDELTAKSDTLAERETEIEELRSSLSWRVTSPLRAAETGLASLRKPHQGKPGTGRSTASET